MADVVIDGGQAKGAETHSADVAPGSTVDWRQSIPAELRNEKSLESVKDIPSLVKGYVEAQKYIGGAIRIPGEKATPEEIKAFRSKLGVPEKVEDYGIKAPILPSHAGWDDEMHAKVLGVAHTAGLTKTQAAKIVEGLTQIVSEGVIDPNVVLEESKGNLREAWGENFDRNLILSSRAADHLAGLAGIDSNEFHEALKETGAGAHPVILRALSALGSGLLEQGLIKNEDTKLETVQDAEGKIKTLRASEKYQQQNHPDHAEAVREMDRLYRLIEANK